MVNPHPSTLLHPCPVTRLHPARECHHSHLRDDSSPQQGVFNATTFFPLCWSFPSQLCPRVRIRPPNFPSLQDSALQRPSVPRELIRLDRACRCYTHMRPHCCPHPRLLPDPAPAARARVPSRAILQPSARRAPAHGPPTPTQAHRVPVGLRHAQSTSSLHLACGQLRLVFRSLSAHRIAPRRVEGSLVSPTLLTRPASANRLCYIRMTSPATTDRACAPQVRHACPLFILK